MPPEDESGLYDRLLEESNGFFRQSVQYFKAAIAYIDALPTNAQGAQRPNLFNCLSALKTVYARLEMYDDLKAVNARMDEIQKAQ